MTLSDRLLWLAACIDTAAGFIAGQAWPQRDAHVSPVLGAFSLLLAAGFTALVLHVRRGRP